MAKNQNKRTTMKNITINLPELYDENIQKLIRLKILPSRSEAIRLALKEFLQKEFSENLDLLGYFKEKNLSENK
ncbi:MAG: ribbon-helix-helix domain-containing protein [Promethearchaeota archaeon]